MCCLTQDPANPYTAYIIDCCTLKITNADGTLVDTFNLNDLDYQIANGILYLKDGDQYIIQPIGYDLQQPEKLMDFQKEIDDIQKAVESKFSYIIDVKGNEVVSEGVSDGVKTKKSKK